jgi:hypothetical protein
MHLEIYGNRKSAETPSGCIEKRIAYNFAFTTPPRISRLSS